MSQSADPLAAIAPALGQLGRAPGLPEGLTGEPGLALLEWLLEEDTGADLFMDAAASYRDFLARNDRPWMELQSTMKTLAYMREYQQFPRFLMFLTDAIDQLDNAEQAQGLIAYLEWLGRRANVMYTGQG
jgi:hypothetical protein